MKRYLFLFLTAIVNLPIVAQQEATNPKTNFIISGNIGNRFYGDTIYISLSYGDLKQNIIANQDFRNFGFSQFQIILNKEGAFYFNLRGYSNKNIRVYISILSKGREYGIMEQFIAEDNDSIHFNAKYINNHFEIQFVGQNADKFNCQWDISNAILFSCDSLNTISINKAKAYSVKNLAGLSKGYSSSAFNILNRYKKKLDTATYQIIKADIIGSTYSCWLEQVLNATKSYNPQQRVETFEMIDKIRKEVLKIPSKSAVLSIPYLILINKLTDFKLLLQANKDRIVTKNTYPLTTLYENIKKNYSDILREYLLITFLLDNVDIYIPQHEESKLNLWNDAYTVFKIPEFKDYAKKRAHYTQKGAPFYHFNLPDTNNNLVDSRKFEGKVMLIDIWFTRCQGCLAYAKRLHDQIYPTFKSDTDLVFVSISGDKDHDLWMSSVRAGQYTRKENVNLYTGGTGFTHPFMKYYDFDGGPFSMIIDKKGNIFIVNPTKHDMPQLTSLLKQALQEP